MEGVVGLKFPYQERTWLFNTLLKRSSSKKAEGYLFFFLLVEYHLYSGKLMYFRFLFIELQDPCSILGNPLGFVGFS